MRSCVLKCCVVFQSKLTYTEVWTELPNGKSIGILIADDAPSSTAVRLTSFDPLYLAPSVMNGRYDEVLEADRRKYDTTSCHLLMCTELHTSCCYSDGG